MALFKKEFLVSTRNSKGILWFIFLFLIWLIQVAVNVVSRYNIQKYQTDISPQSIILQTTQFIIALYFICAFTLRFAFPSFSVEKKTAWILASAPLNFKKIFFSKYIFYTVFLVTVGLLMSSIDVRILHLTFIHATYSMVLFITTVVAIVTLGLTLGAAFPSLDSDDPEIISTSMPGLFFTALALLYGAMSAGILYLVLTYGIIYPVILFTLTTTILIGIALLQIPKIVKGRAF